MHGPYHYIDWLGYQGPASRVCPFFFQAEDGIRDIGVTGVQTCALPILSVIEGYSDYVMHHVGRGLVPHYEHLKGRMAKSRAHRPPLETAVFRLTGLDVKLEIGRASCRERV